MASVCHNSMWAWFIKNVTVGFRVSTPLLQTLNLFTLCTLNAGGQKDAGMVPQEQDCRSGLGFQLYKP